MDKRYQVFISSTFEDLKEERQAALRAILEMDHMPAGMELFPAGDESAWQLICDVIDASDYYVVIIGGRYGSLDEASIGFTEKEYSYALSKKKPVLPLLHANPDTLPRGKTETNPSAWMKLKEFRNKVEESHTCAYWRTADELRAQLIVALIAASKRYPAQGWIRAGGLSSAEASQEILDLRKQLDHYQEEVARLNSAAPEGSDRLAQGDDIVVVGYHVSLTNASMGWNAPGRQRQFDLQTSVTWDELFAAFAPALLSPGKESQVKYHIARRLRERLGNHLESQNEGYRTTSVTISESEFQAIKVQFLALGLIDIRTEAHTNKDGSKEVRVAELTPRGRRHLVSTMAVPKGEHQLRLVNSAKDAESHEKNSALN